MKKIITLLSFLLIAVFCFSTANAATLIGTYEVSYIYNSMAGGDNGTYDNPEGSQSYGNYWTAPIQVSLGPGTYYATVVNGRIDGNPADPTVFAGNLDDYWFLVENGNGPGVEKYDTGYNGGITDPLNYEKYGDETWWNGGGLWVGSSTAYTDGAYSSLGSGQTEFEIAAGDSAWLFWLDTFILDNLGGVTVEIWQIEGSTTPVPAPGALLLLGSGLAGLAGLRRKLKKG